MTNQTNRKPSHAVYHVRGGDQKSGKKGFWTKVGAAWLHDDKEGLNIQLDYLPIGENVKLTVRVLKDEQAADATQGEAA